MNDILARRARRAAMGIALSVALVAGIAPTTATAAETSSPTGAVVLQTEDDKNYLIIDGQQRFTTVTILILAAIKCIKNFVSNLP